MLRIAATLLLLTPLFADDLPVDPDKFAAKQLGNNIELNTPYGPKLLWGDEGLDAQTNYRIEIPLEDLKTKEQKAEERRLAEEAKKRETPPQGNTVETKIIEREKEIYKESARETEREKEKETSKNKAEEGTETPKKVVVEYDETDRFVLEANRLYNRGKFYEASMVVEELLRRRPDFVRGWVMKGSLLHVQGHKDRAKSAWQAALKLDPANAELKRILETYK